jgi:hypothetical protein
MKQYLTLDGRLQDILDDSIKIADITILCGHRNKKEQNKCFKNKTSKLCWPHSKHNSTPSKAMDLAPYPIKWPDKETQSIEEYAECLVRFYFLAGIILAIAYQKGIKVVWGGNWSFKDLVHFELVE